MAPVRVKNTSWCADCHADVQMIRKYGITLADYAGLLADQDGACAICKTLSPGGAHDHRFHVDHCYDTGRVRGLLCFDCNTAIGKFNDDPDMLTVAINYLRSN